MPLFEENPEKRRKPGDLIPPEEVIFAAATYGHAYKQLERVLKKNPNVNINWKNLVGETALHRACIGGSPKMVARLLELGADPNVPATQNYLTPLDYCNGKLDFCKDIKDRLGDWDQVKKLPNFMVYIEPYSAGYEECKRLIIEAGGIPGYMVPEDGFIYQPQFPKFDGASELRSYKPGESYTPEDVKKSGLFIEVTEEMLKERKKKADKLKADAKKKARPKGYVKPKAEPKK
eukprot:gnl/MRDRNA2_/MRDRNA2_89881_c0_seq1.p1 gnl/MRDRNA2_/MRDRNA2_89881_c0~~gnl/MRDRNA2_/MRDRNA2_89881_c0_seq1.p1  ORF type:complete len:233 (+),score=64.82 gnl/MRDRNA2_/MRDRNA2_89881_c0_seq1:75-773(+)